MFRGRHVLETPTWHRMSEEVEESDKLPTELLTSLGELLTSLGTMMVMYALVLQRNVKKFNKCSATNIYEICLKKLTNLNVPRRH